MCGGKVSRLFERIMYNLLILMSILVKYIESYKIRTVRITNEKSLLLLCYHSSNYKHVSSQYVYSSSVSSSATQLPTNDGQCMQWDEDEKEEEEDKYYKQRKKEMEVRQKWNQHEMESTK